MLPILLQVASGLLQIPTAPIPANELRTRADSDWIVATAAKRVSSGTVLSVGRIMLDPRGSPSPGSSDSLLIAVGRALELPMDTVRSSASLPSCRSDTAARGARGYRVTNVSIDRQTLSIQAGRPEWYHYVVEFTRACRRDGRILYVGSKVRFDAMPDTVLSFKWAVGDAVDYSDPQPERPPTFRQRHGGVIGFVIRLMAWSPLIFLLFAFPVGVLVGRRGLLWQLGGWFLAAIAAMLFIGMGGPLSWLVLMVGPPAVFVAGATAGSDDPSTPPAFGRATILFAVAYPICFLAFNVMIWSGL